MQTGRASSATSPFVTPESTRVSPVEAFLLKNSSVATSAAWRTHVETSEHPKNALVRWDTDSFSANVQSSFEEIEKWLQLQLKEMESKAPSDTTL